MTSDLYAGIVLLIIFVALLAYIAGGKNGGVTATGWKRNRLNEFLRRHWR